MSDGKRLFVGVRLSVGTANALAGAAETVARRARDAGLDLRMLAPSSYHVTLKFLGWTRTDAIGALLDALERAVEGQTRFDFRTARLGAFASLDKATVVWAGIEDPAPLAALAAKVDTATEPLGFPREKRPFAAHVTLARLREPEAVRDVILPVSEQMFGGSRVEGVTLFESVTKPSGSVYLEVRRIRFKPAPEAEKRQTEAVDLGASDDTDDGWPRGHT